MALTSILMKCLEHIVKTILNVQCSNCRDVLQFAYREKRCVDDAVLSVIDYILSHVDRPNIVKAKHFVKVLFVDFSSAFNTIQPHILMHKLNMMNVNSRLILWIHDFLTNRIQYVRLNNYNSNTIIIDTGAPQGCVLSPILFTLYTSDCKTTDVNSKLFKYADDTALVSLCINNDAKYRDEVRAFSSWCSDNHLIINVNKTKEMIVDYSRDASHQPLYIRDEKVDVVDEYKYLGVTIDKNFKFDTHVQNVYKKCNQRLYFIRQLFKLRVDSSIIKLFYSAIIQSVLSFATVCWFGNTNNDCKSKLSRIIKQCNKMGLSDICSLAELYKKAVMHRYNNIKINPEHPLHNKYELLPSGRRVRSVKCRTNRYRDSFVPSSVRILNDIMI